MPAIENHITVCICTFKRPHLLRRLLDGLKAQKTAGFGYSVVVTDNDAAESARAIVAEGAGSIAVEYCVEPVQNIAMARNRALRHAGGEFAAFIDDDEVPAEDWLLQLFQAMRDLQADAVLGPVRPYFDSEPPAWVRKGRFFERPEHPTGHILKWTECRSGNLLLRTNMLEGLGEPFRTQFKTAGEDMDFCRRMIDQGRKFVWCNEAPALELVPPDRCTRGFLLKRALLRGSNFPKHPAGRLQNILKSLVAVPSYTLALPFLAAFGEHVFLKYTIKLCDHASRLLAFMGWSVVKERQT